MKTRNGYTNDSNFVSSEFIKENSEIVIPYLLIIGAFTLSGCVGNIMVIGAVLVYRVSKIIYVMHFTIMNFVSDIINSWLHILSIFKPLRKVGNFFVVNLAIADLCITGFVNPFSIIGMYTKASIQVVSNNNHKIVEHIQFSHSIA